MYSPVDSWFLRRSNTATEKNPGLKELEVGSNSEGRSRFSFMDPVLCAPRIQPIDAGTKTPASWAVRTGGLGILVVQSS